MIGNIKRWVEKCVYDASKILFEKMGYPNEPTSIPGKYHACSHEYYQCYDYQLTYIKEYNTTILKTGLFG